MIARDLMNSDFPFVTVDADLDYVAKLLAECGLGAVPVVDAERQPIGIVTRSNLEAPALVAASAELGEIPAFLMRNRAKPVFHANGRRLCDVMTAPVVSASLATPAMDIARLMERRRLKRIPVVDGHRLVGVLLRKAVMEAVENGQTAAAERPVLTIPQPAPEHCDIVTADAFRLLVAEHRRIAEAARDEQKRHAKQRREERINELAAQRLTESQWREMVSGAKRAAEAGLSEYMLIRFPAQLCADGGRAINAPDPHWPETLRGEPADVFHRFRNELRPRGFKIAAQIVDFPEGVPGDGALFLQWGGETE